VEIEARPRDAGDWGSGAGDGGREAAKESFVRSFS